jgi:hypothetical protein
LTRRSPMMWHGRALVSVMAGSSPAMTQVRKLRRDYQNL